MLRAAVRRRAEPGGASDTEVAGGAARSLSGPSPSKAKVVSIALSTDTCFWHPYADMGSVRDSELVIERGEGVWVWGADGNRYLDAPAGLWYANVGHGRPEIRAAVAAQMERLEGYSAFVGYT